MTDHYRWGDNIYMAVKLTQRILFKHKCLELNSRSYNEHFSAGNQILLFNY